MDPKQDKGKASSKVVQKVDGNGNVVEVTKKKHRHTGLKVFIILVLILFVAPIAAAYICFFDSGKSKTVEDESFNTSEVFEQAFVTSLDDVSTNEGFVFSVDTGTLNQILLKTRNSFVKDNATLAEIFTGIELEASQDTFTFKFDFNFKTIFQTRIYLKTTLTEGTRGDNGNCLIFTIKEIKVGRIPGIEWLVKKILPYFGTDDMLQSMFSQTGLSFVSNVKDGEIYYPLKNFPEDVKKKFPTQSTDAFFSAIITQFLDPNKEGNNLTFAEAGLQAFFTLKPYSVNPDYQNYTLSHDFDWKRRINETFREMIKSGVIGKDYTGKDSSGNKLYLHEYLYDYLIRGKSGLSEGEFNALRECLVAYGQEKLAEEFFISDIDEFNGFVFIDVEDPRVDPQSKHKGEGICKPTTSMSDLLAADTQKNLKQAIETGEVPEALFEIDEELLSSLLRSSQIVGYNYLIAGKTKNNSFQVSPIVITDVYSSVISDSLRFCVEMDFNDYPTYMCIETVLGEKSYDPETYTLQLTIDELIYGTEAINDDLKLTILDLLNDSFSLENDMITFTLDEETKSASLLVNCEKIIDTLGEYKETFENMFTTGVKFVDPDEEAGTRGKIQFTLAKK